MSKDRLVCALSAALAVGACARPEVPDARDAAKAYADAARRGDHQAIYAMLSKEAQTAYGEQGTARLVAESKQELARQGQSLAEPGVRVEAVATYRLEDGESAELELAEDGFRVSAAGTFPVAARTPAQALEELRRALSRRSYSALVRVLSSETKSALESEMRTLVEGLSNAETLDVKVEGDSAVVEVPGGHRVRLKREGGVWRVDDLE
jgi:hypothetical protein